MRGIWTPLLRTVVIGFSVAIVLRLAEAYLGWPQGVRMFGGGGLVVLGSMLASGGSGNTLYQKGAVRGITDADRTEHVATRQSNLAVGVRLLIVGGVIFASQFLF